MLRILCRFGDSNGSRCDKRLGEPRLLLPSLRAFVSTRCLVALTRKSNGRVRSSSLSSAEEHEGLEISSMMGDESGNVGNVGTCSWGAILRVGILWMRARDLANSWRREHPLTRSAAWTRQSNEEITLAGLCADHATYHVSYQVERRSRGLVKRDLQMLKWQTLGLRIDVTLYRSTGQSKQRPLSSSNFY